MLGDGSLGGNATLDFELAGRSLEPLAEELGLTVDEVARGVLRISAAAMANATREISVECGYDPRDAALVAFGGAGPLFATLLARELGSRHVVIPPVAGNFSAWGLLGADVVREAAQTFLATLDDAVAEEAEAVLSGLFHGLASRATGDAGVPEAAADLRYRGQEHTLTVPISLEGGQVAWESSELAERFGESYAETFFHALDHDVEVVALRARVRTRTAMRDWPPLPEPGSNGRGPDVDAYSFSGGERMRFTVVDRLSLRVGDEIAGPAIVTERTTTTYLDAGFIARVHPSGCLLLEPAGGEA
jgi:N-methylhydantoinase A